MCLKSERKAIRDRRHFVKQKATAMSTASLDENRRLNTESLMGWIKVKFL